jgi:RimJ/RimL family protein N-acetyltransferase
MIETKRLLLRVHEPQDLDAYAAFRAELAAERIRRHTAWARLLRSIGHHSLFGFGNFLAFDRATGDLVGEAGFNYFERGIGPDFDPAPEAMWMIRKADQGKALASEAMQAIVAWFDATIDITRTVAMVDAPNEPSLRIAERLGFRSFRETTYDGKLMILFERVRD